MQGVCLRVGKGLPATAPKTGLLILLFEAHSYKHKSYHQRCPYVVKCIVFGQFVVVSPCLMPPYLSSPCTINPPVLTDKDTWPKNRLRLRYSNRDLQSVASDVGNRHHHLSFLCALCAYVKHMRVSKTPCRFWLMPVLLKVADPKFIALQPSSSDPPWAAVHMELNRESLLHMAKSVTQCWRQVKCTSPRRRRPNQVRLLGMWNQKNSSPLRTLSIRQCISWS